MTEEVIEELWCSEKNKDITHWRVMYHNQGGFTWVTVEKGVRWSMYRTYADWTVGQRRGWFRSRWTTTDCVFAAIQYAHNKLAEEKQAKLEAECAREEAQALAEFARELA